MKRYASGRPYFTTIRSTSTSFGGETVLQTLRQMRRWVGTLLQLGKAPSIFGASRKKSSSAAALLHIPTSDGSGEACHPSAVHIPNGFAGYRFWMVNTPYPKNAHKLENPELFGSNDGVFWEVPAGVQNPLVSAPDGDERHYNSDPCLLYHGDRLLLYFRTSDEESQPRRDWISMMTSSNGRDWSKPRPVLNDATGRLLLCPAVRAVDGKFLMWTVENTGGPLLTICRRTSADGENWTTPEPTQLIWPHHPLEPWHIDVVQQEAKLAMVFSGRVPGRQGTQLFYGATGNGNDWDVHGPLDTDVCAFERGKAYKPSLVVMGEGISELRLYTSSNGLDRRWYTALRPYSFQLP